MDIFLIVDGTSVNVEIDNTNCNDTLRDILLSIYKIPSNRAEYKMTAFKSEFDLDTPISSTSVTCGDEIIIDASIYNIIMNGLEYVRCTNSHDYLYELIMMNGGFQELHETLGDNGSDEQIVRLLLLILGTRITGTMYIDEGYRGSILNYISSKFITVEFIKPYAMEYNSILTQSIYGFRHVWGKDADLLKIVSEIIHRDSHNVRYIDAELYSNKELMINCLIWLDSDAIVKTIDALRDDIDIAVKVITTHPRQLKYMSDRVRNDKNIKYRSDRLKLKYSDLVVRVRGSDILDGIYKDRKSIYYIANHEISSNDS